MATPQIQLSLTEVVGSSVCVSIEDGTKVHDKIVDAINAGSAVALSFHGVGRLTTAFLNAAVGQLYNEYDEAEVRQRLLPPTGATQEQLTYLKRVVDNAKIFFANRDAISNIVTNTRGDA
jgi:hypothetical protein